MRSTLCSNSLYTRETKVQDKVKATTLFPTGIHCKHKVIHTLRKMRLAPAQTHYKLKIVNRVEETVIRKAGLQKIACEN